MVAEVLRLANRTHNLTKIVGATDLTERIETEAASWKDNEVRVVVAGEIKRGKTSFINSMLGQPGLLPVDADVATSVHLAVRHAPSLTVEAVRRLPDSEAEERITLRPDQLVDYASMQGKAVLREGVLGVEIGLPHPLLERGLVVIDTPGVGGLTRGHRDSALTALRRADALFFAVSVEEPISLSELKFLAEASERIDSVVLILTKVDSSADPQAMMVEDRTKLREFVEVLRRQANVADDEDAREAVRRFARVAESPFLPVSSRLADKAKARAAAGREEAAASLEARSGFADIGSIFDRTLQNRELVRMSNILRLVGHVLARVESEQIAQVRVAAGDIGAVEAELKARQALLEELAPSQARWRQRLAGNVQRIQADLNRVIGREMTRIDRVYRDHIDSAGKDVDPIMANLGNDLGQSIEAAWAAVAHTLAQRLDAAVTNIAAEFNLDEIVLELPQTGLPDYLSDLGVDGRGDPNAGKADFVQDGLPGVLSMGALGSLAGALIGPALGVALTPLLPGVLLAAPVTYARYKKRHQIQVRQDYLRIVREVVAQVRQEFQAEFTLKIIEAREAVESTVDGAITARKQAIEGQRRELHQLLQQSKAEQQQRRAAAEKQLSGVRALRADADKLRAKVDAALGAPPTPT
ncbi:hypothetical protein HC251_00775 [Iamia sp. SCSIO 61187]|nr:hypothetical protein HC251_00775 [Iamia sp. SCSIO 61187]